VNAKVQIARILGIPIIINVSWLLTLGFVTSILALRFYPAVLPRTSPYRDDELLHWIMALSSGLIFFASILLHELAHSVLAIKLGIAVKSITLFIFGGVSQISSDAKRPLHEFIIAIVGPLMSVVLAVLFLGLWFVAGGASTDPVSIVLEWLFLMNLVLAIFNMAPGFPMDGGRVLRSILWGITGKFITATRLATLVGRATGYGLMLLGGVAIFGVIEQIDPWSGVWFGILGMFLESSARQSWFQARALDVLSSVKAEEIMNADLETAQADEGVRLLADRGTGRHFIYFVSDKDDKVVGVLTEKEVHALRADRRDQATAQEVMVAPASTTVATPAEDGASMLQRMDAASVWHLPVVSEGRVVGVVSKDRLLRLLEQHLIPRPRFANQR
jgi:Zn-dependent protease/CBS domain-containing protein